MRWPAPPPRAARRNADYCAKVIEHNVPTIPGGVFSEAETQGQL